MATLKEKSSCLIVTPGQTSYSSIEGIAKRVFSPIRYADSMAAAKQLMSRENYAVVIINTPIKDEFGVQSAIDIARRTTVNILLLVKADLYEQTAYNVRGTGIFVLSRPVKGEVILEAARMLESTHRKIQELSLENGRLQRRLDEMGVVTRAKCVLIEHRHMTEPEAHHFLEKLAMDNSITKKEAAQQILREIEEECPS